MVEFIVVTTEGEAEMKNISLKNWLVLGAVYNQIDLFILELNSSLFNNNYPIHRSKRTQLRISILFFIC